MRTVPGGILVAFEGIDGAGKTTQAEALVASLGQLGFDAVRTKEPTAGPHGKRIREAARTHRLPAAEELDLFMLDRVDHVRDELRPWLEAGRVVVVDRYYFSTVAYQGARGADPAELQQRNEAIAPRPDLLVVMDIGAREGLARVHARGAADAFENERELEAARAIFATLRGGYVQHMDARRSIKELAADILLAFANGPLLARGEHAVVDFVRQYHAACQVSRDQGVADQDKAAVLLGRIMAAVR